MKGGVRSSSPQALPSVTGGTDLGGLQAQLARLGLEFASEALPRVLSEAVKEDWSGPALLGRVLASELERREERRLRTSLRLSGLPTGLTLAGFDYAFQPSVERSKVEALATCAWVRDRQSLLLLGPPGVGKTHLAVSLGVRAVECGFSVAFYRLEGLMHALRRDASSGPTQWARRKYMSAALLVIDEMGFNTFTKEESNLFFRLVSHRYQRGSTCITSNKGVRDWPEVLGGDEVVAAAALDRLLHGGHVLNIRGRSYRLRELDEATRGAGRGPQGQNNKSANHD